MFEVREISTGQEFKVYWVDPTNMYYLVYKDNEWVWDSISNYEETQQHRDTFLKFSMLNDKNKKKGGI